MGKADFPDGANAMSSLRTCEVQVLDFLLPSPFVAEPSSDAIHTVSEEPLAVDLSGRMDWEVDQHAAMEVKSRINTLFSDIPEDFRHFYFTEFGRDALAILFANDEWAHPNFAHGCKPFPTSALTPRQRTIAVWRGVNAIGDIRISPFLLNWLDERAESDECSVEVQLAPSYQSQFGAGRHRASASHVLSAGNGSSRSAGASPRCVRWGNSISSEERWALS